MSDLSNDRGYVTDGGMETDLIFHRGIDLPEFAAFPLLEEATGRALLAAYYDDYAQVAARVGAGLVLESPTWRANPDWGARLGYGPTRLAAIDREAVRFLHGLAAGYAQDVPDVLVCGMVGPRGDGYVVGRVMSSDEAAEYHRPQIDSFAASGVDVVTAYTLTGVTEAIGIVEAARGARVAVAVSFTVEVDGLLPDETGLAEALAIVEAAAPPDYFPRQLRPSGSHRGRSHSDRSPSGRSREEWCRGGRLEIAHRGDPLQRLPALACRSRRGAGARRGRARRARSSPRESGRSAAGSAHRRWMLRDRRASRRGTLGRRQHGSARSVTRWAAPRRPISGTVDVVDLLGPATAPGPAGPPACDIGL